MQVTHLIPETRLPYTRCANYDELNRTHASPRQYRRRRWTQSS